MNSILKLCFNRETIFSLLLINSVISLLSYLYRILVSNFIKGFEDMAKRNSLPSLGKKFSEVLKGYLKMSKY